MLRVLILSVTFLLINWGLTESKLHKSLMLPQGTIDCLGTLCNTNDSYPAQKIHIIANKKQFKSCFGSVFDSSSPQKPTLPVIRKTVAVEQPENLCKTESHSFAPRVGLIGNKKYFLVNTGNESQTITVELCLNEKCDNAPDIFGYRSFCQQLHSNVKLLYAEHDSVQVKLGNFRFPSGCACAKIKV